MPRPSSPWRSAGGPSTRWSTASPATAGPGLLAGVLAAFSSHQMFHVYHLNLLSIGWLALFLLGLHRIARAGIDRGRGPGRGLVCADRAVQRLLRRGGGRARARVRRLSRARRCAEPRAARLVLGAAALAVLLTLPYLLAFRALQEEQGIRRPPGMSVKMAFHPSRDLTSWAHVYIGLLGGDGEVLFPGAPAARARRRRRARRGRPGLVLRRGGGRARRPVPGPGGDRRLVDAPDAVPVAVRDPAVRQHAAPVHVRVRRPLPARRPRRAGVGAPGPGFEAVGGTGHRPARDRGDDDRRPAPARDPARPASRVPASSRRCPRGRSSRCRSSPRRACCGRRAMAVRC